MREDFSKAGSEDPSVGEVSCSDNNLSESNEPITQTLEDMLRSGRYWT